MKFAILNKHCNKNKRITTLYNICCTTNTHAYERPENSRSRIASQNYQLFYLICIYNNRHDNDIDNNNNNNNDNNNNNNENNNIYCTNILYQDLEIIIYLRYIQYVWLSRRAACNFNYFDCYLSYIVFWLIGFWFICSTDIRVFVAFDAFWKQCGGVRVKRWPYTRDVGVLRAKCTLPGCKNVASVRYICNLAKYHYNT